MTLKNVFENPTDIEKETGDQANNPSCFSYSKNRLTALVCNEVGKNGPKTGKN